jgi:hypothetical protein
MILYEVSIDLDRSIHEKYLVWLKGHIKEILPLPGFISAELFDVEQSSLASDRLALTVHYRLQTRDFLEDYLRHHAPRLRQQAIDLFGSAFTPTRRILKSIQTFGAP